MNRQLTIEIQEAIKHMKRASASEVIRKMQVKQQ